MSSQRPNSPKILVRAFQKYVNFLNISGVLGQQKNWLLASY